MSYRIRTDNFEGPFDLLLYLVSRQRVDIGTISLAEITDQYLQAISDLEQVDLDVASDFLLVAATLLEIKAESLVPRQHDEVDEEILQLAPSEARNILVIKLVEYKKYKNIAAMLESRAKAQERMHARPFGPDVEFTRVMPDFLHGVTLDSLANLAAEVYGRRDIALLDSEHIAAKPIPVEMHVRALHKQIAARKTMKFSEMINADTPTPVVVVTFLAVLELYKRAKISITQDEMFGDIVVTYKEGSGELDLESDPIDEGI